MSLVSADGWEVGDRLQEAYTGQIFKLTKPGGGSGYVWAWHPASGEKLWRTDQFKNLDLAKREAAS